MPTASHQTACASSNCSSPSLPNTARPEDPRSRPVLEQFIYAVCREGVTGELARPGFSQPNASSISIGTEVRVSSSHGFSAESLDCLPNSEARGRRIIDFLQEVFETTYLLRSGNPCRRKGVKQAAKQLEQR